MKKKNKEKEEYNLMVFDESKIHFNEIKAYELSSCAILPYISSDKIIPNELFVLNGVSYSGLFQEKDKKLIGITVNVMKDGVDKYNFDPEDIVYDVNRAYVIIEEKGFKGFFILPNMGIAMDYDATVGTDSLYSEPDDSDDDMSDEEFSEFINEMVSKQKPC